MYKLSLPDFDVRLQKRDQQLHIFDVCRGKYVALTPEEWVRQHFVHYLLANGYPRTLMRTESGLKYGTRAKRSDILVHHRDGGVFMLVECKAPSVALGPNVLQQALAYHSVLGAKHIALTNGLEHWYIGPSALGTGTGASQLLPAFG